MKRVGLFLIMLIVCGGFSTIAPWIDYPDYFPEPHYDFSKNTSTAATISIGRALFYDPILSEDNTISCSSCHSPYNAFAHTDHALSHGIADQIGTRNAPALFNLAWNKSFMWDGAINDLDLQALAPIEHTKEMGSNIQDIIEKLNNSSLYPELFQNAYGDSMITGARMLKTLAQFQLSLVSDNAKYDQVRRTENEFSVQEKAGYDLFLAHCNSCHREPLFTTGDLAVNGLPIDSSLKDTGRELLSHHPTDSMHFKVPSLRNLKYSYPYMHDGRFTHLSQVVDHYNQTNVNHKDERLATISLDDHERTDLVAFLLTLTDTSFVFNKKFQFPREILLPSTN